MLRTTRGAVLIGASAAFSEPFYVFKDNTADYFNQWHVTPAYRWMTNMVWLDSLAGGTQINIVSEVGLGVGARPASNVGRRIAWALMSILSQLFTASEATLLADQLDPLRHNRAEVRRRRVWLSRRHRLSRRSGRDE